MKCSSVSGCQQARQLLFSVDLQSAGYGGAWWMAMSAYPEEFHAKAG